VPISFASFIACFLNSSSYCFPVPIDDTLLCFYYTLIVLYVSSFIIQDYNAKLFCVGRDIENAEISLHFDSDLKKWIVTDELSTGQSKDNIFLAALYVYLKKHISFTGTASELVSELKEVTQEQFYPNRVTRDLVRNGYTLRKYGIDFQYKRTRNGRLIILHYDCERDSSDSKNSTVVTVNGAHKQYLANP